jgi:L-asparaginase / beta-aspartyl-peptidase
VLAACLIGQEARNYRKDLSLMTIAIIVHGGASPVPPDEVDACKQGCLAAVQVGWAVLERGGNACDAVEAAIRSFEDDETFNAA